MKESYRFAYADYHCRQQLVILGVILITNVIQLSNRRIATYGCAK